MIRLDLATLNDRIGDEIAVSPWFEIDQARVNSFADTTEDRQWIHVDAERAARSPYGSTIAHGFLTLSLVSPMLRAAISIPARFAINYGLNRVRFMAPVPVGSRVRGRLSVASVAPVHDGVQVVWTVVVERDGSEKPCAVVEWIVRYHHAVTSLYDIKTLTLDGQAADLAMYKGSVSLVVNVASQCGFTPQYEGLEMLQRELHAKGFTVLGFPSNDFGGQEPGTAGEIHAFCRKNYGVTFPLFEKVVTKPGPGQSAVYSFLSECGTLPEWNFAKYLVDRNGQVVAFFPSRVTPESIELRGAIARALTA